MDKELKKIYLHKILLNQKHLSLVKVSEGGVDGQTWNKV
jgi:hypothetical protein